MGQEDDRRPPQTRPVAARPRGPETTGRPTHLFPGANHARDPGPPPVGSESSFRNPERGAPSGNRRGPHTRGRRNPKVRHTGSCSEADMNEDDRLVWLPTSFMTAPNPDLTPKYPTLLCKEGGTSDLSEGDHAASTTLPFFGRGARTPHSPDHTSVWPASPTSSRLAEEGKGGGRPTRFHSLAVPVETPWYVCF